VNSGTGFQTSPALGPSWDFSASPAESGGLAKVSRVGDVIVGHAADEPKPVEGFDGQVAVAGKAVKVLVNDPLATGSLKKRGQACRRVRELSLGLERTALPTASKGERDPVPLKELVQLREIDFRFAMVRHIEGRAVRGVNGAGAVFNQQELPGVLVAEVLLGSHPAAQQEV